MKICMHGFSNIKIFFNLYSYVLENGINSKWYISAKENLTMMNQI